MFNYLSKLRNSALNQINLNIQDLFIFKTRQTREVTGKLTQDILKPRTQMNLSNAIVT